MGIMAFSPMGNTVTFTAATSAPTPVQAVSSTTAANQYLVQNPSAQTVFLGVGSTAAARLGDCDDFSMYAASLLTALDIPCNFVTVAGDESNPNIFTHVYVAAYPNGERVVVDASHGPECGWEVYRPSGRKQEWAVSGNAPNAGMSVGWLVAAGVAVLGFVLCGGKL